MNDIDVGGESKQSADELMYLLLDWHPGSEK